MNELLRQIEKSQLRKESLGEFRVGDTVDVHLRIKEGDKERVQVYTGTLIRHQRGHGKINEAITVRRIVDGVGVERVFPVNSPTLVKVTVSRHGRVRRAKLYYLRTRVGKATKTKELVENKVEAAAPAKA